MWLIYRDLSGKELTRSTRDLQDLTTLILKKQVKEMHKSQTWIVYMQLPVAKVLEKVTVSASTYSSEMCLLLTAESSLVLWALQGQAQGLWYHWHAKVSCIPPKEPKLLLAEGPLLHMAKELLGAPWGPLQPGAAFPPPLGCWALGFFRACAQLAAVEGTKCCIVLNGECWSGWFFPKLGFPRRKLPSWFSGSYKLLTYFLKQIL